MKCALDSRLRKLIFDPKIGQNLSEIILNAGSDYSMGIVFKDEFLFLKMVGSDAPMKYYDLETGKEITDAYTIRTIEINKRFKERFG